MRVVVYTGSPCFYCEARGSCRHRQVEDAPVIVEQKELLDQRKVDRSQGHNFHKRKANLNSRWGKAGNPTKREFLSVLDPTWRPKT